MSLLEAEATVRHAFHGSIDVNKLTLRKLLRMHREAARLLRHLRGEVNEQEELLRQVGVF